MQRHGLVEAFHQAAGRRLVPIVQLAMKRLERESFEAVRGHFPEQLRGVVTFAYIIGWRVQSEAIPLQWRQVDMTACTV